MVDTLACSSVERMAVWKAGWSGSLLVDQMEGLKVALLAGWLGRLLVDSMAAWTAVQ
jgi:hypothetical protein